MKAVIGSLFFLLLLASLGAWWLTTTSPPQDAVAQPELSSTTSPATASDTDSQTVPVSTRVDVARQRVTDAKLALQVVAAERKKVGAQLEQAERDVTELERFVEDIEARGEDPADYAEEGLDMFQPAFYAYQDAFDKLELIDGMHKAAQEEVAVAEQQLAEILAQSEDE